MSVTKSKEPPSNELVIDTYLHCGMCIDERPQGLSPEEWASLSVGYTPVGLQIWCIRHQVNVLHVDFHKEAHYANTTRA